MWSRHAPVILPSHNVPTLGIVHVVVVRVWLPDRPGALGQVASRIGAVRGDVLSIEILETGGGRVIDELVVALPDAALVDLMVNEVHAIDGVSVEHVRTAEAGFVDSGVLSLSLAADLVEQRLEHRVATFLAGVTSLTEATWAMLACGDAVVDSIGEAPAAEWVSSLRTGSRHLEGSHMTSSHLFWSDLPTSGHWVAAGREGRTVHDRERLRLDLFARVADALLATSVGRT